MTRIKGPTDNHPVLEFNYLQERTGTDYHIRMRTPIPGATEPEHFTLCGKWYPLFAEAKDELAFEDRCCPQCLWVIDKIMLESGARKV